MNTPSTYIRVVTFNTYFGGHVDAGYGPDVHWEAQMAFLRELKPDILALQECNQWDALGKRRLHRAVNELDMARGFLAEANQTTDGHRFHSALLLSDRIRVVAEGADTHRYHHVLGWAKLRLPGVDRLLDVRNIQLDPFDPRNRAREIAPLEVLADPARLSLVLGDANSIGLDFPEPDWDSMSSHLLNGHLLPPGQEKIADREAAQLLHRAGFIDLATKFGHAHVPTGGFAKGDVPRRLDLALASQPVAAATVHYEVHDQPVTDSFSDHCAVSIDLDAAQLSGEAPR